MKGKKFGDIILSESEVKIIDRIVRLISSFNQFLVEGSGHFGVSIREWWRKYITRKIENYGYFISGASCTGIVILLLICEFCLEYNVLITEIRTMNMRVAVIDGVSFLFAIWPMIKLGLMLAATCSFLLGGIWFIRKAYDKNDWVRNTELEEQINKCYPKTA